MAKRKKSKNLQETELRYFISILVSCIVLFLIGLIVLELLFAVFEIGPYIRLVLFAVIFILSAMGSYRIAESDVIHHLIDAIHR